jgi:pimeloyl-ACP methyl ester carboxylesterase
MSNLEQKRFAISFNGINIKVAAFVANRQETWVVAMHGIQSNKALFEPLFSQPFASHYSLLAIDFVGFGDSDKPEKFSYTVEDQATIVKLILDQLGVHQMHLIGHSLGGMVGTLLLPQLGKRVISFTNLEGNLVATDSGATKDTVQFSKEAFESVEYANMRSRISQSEEASAVYRLKWLQTIPASVFYETSVSVVKWANSEKLQTIFNTSRTKRLFLYGSKNASKANAVSDSVTKVEVPNSGHFMLLDDPEACFRAFAAFITS